MKVTFGLRWVLTVPLLALLSIATGQGEPTLSLVKRDFQQCDPVTDRFIYHTGPSGHSTPLPDIEWPSSVGREIPVVYQKGESIVVRLWFRNNNQLEDFQGQIVVGEATFIQDAHGPPGSNPPAPIPLTGSPVSLSVPKNGAENYATLTLQALPPWVSRGRVHISYHVEGNFGYQVPGGVPIAYSASQVWETTYVTYAVPTQSQSLAWREVLDFSCIWAGTKNTEADVIEFTTSGLYFGGVFAYNLGTPGVPNEYFSAGSTTGGYRWTYRLRRLFNDLAANAPVGANCADVAGLLATSLDSHGIQHNVMKRTSSEIVYDDSGAHQREFVTNLFCPIGSNPINPGLHIRTLLVSHFQTTRTGQIHDATLGYRHNLDASVRNNPAWQWPIVSAWQTLTGQSDPSATGLVFRYPAGSDPGFASHPNYPFLQWMVDPQVPAATVPRTDIVFPFLGYFVQ